MTGAVVKDVLTGRRYAVYAKVVINATGPFTGAWVRAHHILFINFNYF